MNILNFFKKKQDEKQALMRKHEGVHAYMKHGVKTNLPDFTVDENVYHAYVTNNNKVFSIACDPYGYQISVLIENRFDFIGKYNASDYSQEWNKEDASYEEANELLNAFYVLAKKEQKIS